MAAKEIASGVFCLPVSIANVYFAGEPNCPWVLVDAGLPGDAKRIRLAAESLYGAEARPSAIYLTHGHPDHAGSALELANLWDVPILAHSLEIPYLTGKSEYPPLDPTVGGFLALLGRFFRPGQINLKDRVRAFDGEQLFEPLAGWELVHTPGHSPGHVAFFRRVDGTLLTGDAITTVNLNSFFASLTKFKRVCGPPPTATYDWNQAAASVVRLAELQPITIACGHGAPMSGGEAVMQLAELAAHLPRPVQGRYRTEPAVTDKNGIVWLPPRPVDTFAGTALGLGIAASAGALVAVAAWQRKKRKKSLATADTPAQAS
jgi:glyoxylase-like metal-dependent hydrolase (beta-lactamase superfamily II)